MCAIVSYVEWVAKYLSAKFQRIVVTMVAKLAELT